MAAPPPDERQQAVDNFQALKDTDRTGVFLASITAASTGLTLTAADTVVFVESDWLPANLEQAEGRVLRKTQDAPLCRAIYLVVPDTMDEAVQRAVARKTNRYQEGSSRVSRAEPFVRSKSTRE